MSRLVNSDDLNNYFSCVKLVPSPVAAISIASKIYMQSL